MSEAGLMEPALPTAAVIEVPKWLFGGDPESFFESAALRVRRRVADSWHVQTIESYNRQKPQLIAKDDLPLTLEGGAYDAMNRRAAAAYEDRTLAELDRERFLQALKDRLDPNDLTTLFSLCQASIQLAPAQELASTTAAMLRDLRNM